MVKHYKDPCSFKLDINKNINEGIVPRFDLFLPEKPAC
jgi:hypothetical protein